MTKPMVYLILAILLGLYTLCVVIIWHLILLSRKKEERHVEYYDDGTPPKFYITGDKHRDFSYVKAFCKKMGTRQKDVLIILGDAGFNYYEDERDDKLKEDISTLNITLFCIHGNKEDRPQNVGTYGIRSFCGGKVYYEPRYPNIYFAMDGEIYTFEGKRYMVIGGAHSVDKLHCLFEGMPYWEDEVPSAEIKESVEQALLKENYKIYGMLTHTCPINYLPTEMLLSTRTMEIQKKRPSKKRNKKVVLDIDRSVEDWLSQIEMHLEYHVWYCGHYHIDKQIDNIYMMYREIRPLHMGVRRK